MPFIKIGKSTIINLAQVKQLRLEYNGKTGAASLFADNVILHTFPAASIAEDKLQEIFNCCNQDIEGVTIE